MAWLIVQVGDREKSHEIDTDILFVGSAEDAEVRVTGADVAAKHCQIVRSGEAYKLLDLGSPAGTSVNGTAIRQHELRPGDQIQIGAVTLRFDAGAPRAAPAAAPVRPSSVSASRRARSATSRGSTAASGARSSGESSTPRRRTSAARPGQRAAAGGDAPRLVRRNPRKPSGLPTPVVWAIVGVCLLSGSLVTYKIVTHEKTDVMGLIAMAHSARDLNNWEEAAQLLKTALDNIDESHNQWTYITQFYKEVSQAKSNLQEMSDDSREKEIFTGQVKPFYDKYIDTEERQYKDDPTTSRYFVEFRCQVYLDRYPNGANAGLVNSWADRAKRLYNSSDPFPAKWWDYELISAMEQKLEHHGKEWSVLNDFKQRYPQSKHMTECEDKIALAHKRAKTYWRDYILGTKVEPAIKSRYFARVFAWLQRAHRNLTGIPEFEKEIAAKVYEARDLALANKIPVDLAEMGFVGLSDT